VPGYTRAVSKAGMFGEGMTTAAPCRARVPGDASPRRHHAHLAGHAPREDEPPRQLPQRQAVAHGMGSRPTKEAHSGFRRLPSTASPPGGWAGRAPAPSLRLLRRPPSPGAASTRTCRLGSHVLEVDQEDVEAFEHLGRGLAGVGVEGPDGNAQPTVHGVERLDHVVLHVGPEAVLGSEEGPEPRPRLRPRRPRRGETPRPRSPGSRAAPRARRTSAIATGPPIEPPVLRAPLHPLRSRGSHGRDIDFGTGGERGPPRRPTRAFWRQCPDKGARSLRAAGRSARWTPQGSESSEKRPMPCPEAKSSVVMRGDDTIGTADGPGGFSPATDVPIRNRTFVGRLPARRETILALLWELNLDRVPGLPCRTRPHRRNRILLGSRPAWVSSLGVSEGHGQLSPRRSSAGSACAAGCGTP